MNRKGCIIAILFIFLAAGTSCALNPISFSTEEDLIGCRSDDDCSRGYECVYNECLEEEVVEEETTTERIDTDEEEEIEEEVEEVKELECEKDSDCKSGEVCEENECIEEGGLCENNNDCDPEYSCEDGICIEDDVIDSQANETSNDAVTPDTEETTASETTPGPDNATDYSSPDDSSEDDSSEASSANEQWGPGASAPYLTIDQCDDSKDCLKNQVCISLHCYDAECSDGVDNDGDGFIDYSEDGGCTSSEDKYEGDQEKKFSSAPVSDEEDFFDTIMGVLAFIFTR
jgi:hypothetical protein